MPPGVTPTGPAADYNYYYYRSGDIASKDPLADNHNDVPLTEQPSDLSDISEHCEDAG